MRAGIAAGLKELFLQRRLSFLGVFCYINQYHLCMNAEVNKALAVLEAGGTILYPTDTVWGLGCDATNEAAVQKLFDIKERPAEKSFVILLPDVKSVLAYVANPVPDLMGLLKSFERPTTVVYPQAVGIAAAALPADGSAAIRVTADPFCKMLLKRFKKPIIATSANISGAPTPRFFAEVSDEIKQRVDYIVQHRQDDREMNAPSRIVKIHEDGSMTVIRD